MKYMSCSYSLVTEITKLQILTVAMIMIVISCDKSLFSVFVFEEEHLRHNFSSLLIFLRLIFQRIFLKSLGSGQNLWY